MKYISPLIIAAILMMVGCDLGTTTSNVDIPPRSDVDEGKGVQYQVSMFDSTLQQDDPYTIENMQLALKELIELKNPENSENVNTAAAGITPNHLYVRFLPEGLQQKTDLRRQDIVLSEYPLDYQEKNRWEGYIDKSLPDSVQAYYAAVPIDYDFGNEIKYEIIKSLFLPSTVETEVEQQEAAGAVNALYKVSSKNSMYAWTAQLAENNISMQELEIASRFLTNNLNSEFQNSALNVLGDPNRLKKQAASSSRWRPSGTLKYSDQDLGVVPLAGVRVTAGYSYYWRSSTTNANGYFSSPERWYYSVKYKAHWDAHDFLMEDGNSWYGEDLVTQGPTSYSAWNRTFTGKEAAYAAIFSAAYNYYYGNIDGLKRPHQNGWLSVSLDLQIYNNNDPGTLGSHYVVPFLANWINIYTKTSGGAYRTGSNVYGTTIHELAHNAHYESFQTRYTWTARDFEWNNHIDDIVQETFARGIQWHLTSKRYPGYTIPHYSGIYTGVIEDLVDANGLYGIGNKAGEAISGFSINHVESAFLKSFTLDEAKTNLESSYPSGSGGRVYTPSDMKSLFNFWQKKYFTQVPLDIYGLVNNYTGTGKTEIHRLTRNSNFQSFDIQVGSVLGTNSDYTFAVGDHNGDGTNDVYVFRNRNSANKFEIRVLNGRNNFQSTLVTSPAPLVGLDHTWEATVGNFNNDDHPDVYVIGRQGASGKTEVHVLDGANNYRSFLSQTATVLGHTSQNFTFEVGDYNRDGFDDIYAINRVGAKTDVHILNGANQFQSYLHQIATVLGVTNSNFEFKLADYNHDGILDIYAIYKTGWNNKTEAHILNGATNFQNFLLQIGTGLPTTNIYWKFE